MSSTESESFTIAHGDVLFVGMQINLDLQAVGNAYPNIISTDRIFRIFREFSNFLVNAAVEKLGFAILDPQDKNLVYHEFEYRILYGDAVRKFNPSGNQIGGGGGSIRPVRLPAKAEFVEWLKWSQTMINLPVTDQQKIIANSTWSIPGQGGNYQPRYEGGTHMDRGAYGRGNLLATGREYRLENRSH